MTNTRQNQPLNGADKVLFKAHFNYHLQNGKTEAEATALAFDKIAQVRKMAKTLTFKF
jgi:hypothetical protein